MNISYLETYTKVDFTDFRTLSKSAHDDDDGRGEKSNEEALWLRQERLKCKIQGYSNGQNASFCSFNMP